MRSRWHSLSVDKSAVLCTALAYLINYNTLDAGFTYDDSRAILSNADVLPSTPISSIWKNDFWGTAINSSNSHGSYRPLSVITFRLNYWISGFKPWSYHVVNVILHSISTYLVFVLGRILLPHPAQITAALLFAVHPVHCEAVASIVGRADILANIFFILSFLCYIEHVRLRNNFLHNDSVRRKQFFFKNANKMCKYRFYNGDSATNSCKVASLLKWLYQLSKINIYLSEVEALSNSLKTFYAIGEWILLFASLTLASMAMFSKETGLTVLAVCATYDIVKTKHLPHKRYQLYRSLFFLALTISVLLAFRFYVTDRYSLPTFATSDNPASKEKNFLTRTLTFLYLPIFNFLLLVFPSKLGFDWSMDAIPRITTVFDARNALTVIFYTTAFNFVKKCSRLAFDDRAYDESTTTTKKFCKCCWIRKLHRVVNKSNGVKNGLSNALIKCDCRYSRGETPNTRRACEIYLISLSLLALPFVPATNLFFYVGFVVAERVLYIPSVGYCFFVAVAHEMLEKRVNFKYFRVFFSALIIAFSVRTFLRNKDWHNEESLYRSGIEINPPKAYANLGSILSSQGRVEEAEQALKTALRYRPSMADAHYNLGILQQGKAQYEEAINSYKEAIRLRPSLALAHLNLGQLLASRGLCEEAEIVLRRCSKLDSTGVKDPKLHETTRISASVNLGRLLADRGRYTEAISIYREAVNSLPEYYQPQVLYNLLGEALTHIGRHDEAERWHKAAIQAKPDHIPTHLIYGKLLAKNRTRVAEAEEKFLKAQELAPQDPAVHQHFGQFLSQIQRYNDAASQYLEALKLAPTEYELAVAAATAFRQAGHSQQAEQLYRQAVSMRPTEPAAHINLGAMLHLNGKFKQAASYYQNALKLNPSDQMALQNFNKLRAFLKKN